MADYYDDLLNAVSNCSHHITGGKLTMQEYFPDARKNKNKFKNTLAHILKIFKWAQKTEIPVGVELKSDEFFFGEKSDHPHALLSYGIINIQ